MMDRAMEGQRATKAEGVKAGLECPSITGQVAKDLGSLIAAAIAGEKAYNVPGICRRYGLEEGSEEEAFRSKYKYVQARVVALDKPAIFALAKAVQEDYPSFELKEAIAKLEEKTGPTISQLTRRRIVDTLDKITLSGRISEFDLIESLWPIKSLRAPENSSQEDMHDYLAEYWFVNDHVLVKKVYEKLGIYSCSQAQLFGLIEAIVDPVALDRPAQSELVARLNGNLALDGFELKASGIVSGSPSFKVVPAIDGACPSDEGIGNTLEAFDPAEIHSRWEEALKRRASDPRAAITLARTLLEDTCKWIIHAAGETYRDEDDLPVLYRSLAKILKLAPDQHTEQVFKQILGSCQSIVESLGAIRNKLGDAHSQGPVRAKPQTRHAQLAVNLAGTMATFLIATWEARTTGTP